MCWQFTEEKVRKKTGQFVLEYSPLFPQGSALSWRVAEFGQKAAVLDVSF